MPHPFLSCLARLAALLLAAAAPSAHAALDANANVDDHSINKPADWWVITDLTPASLATKIDQLNARPVGIEVTAVNNGTPTMTVRLVRNSGAYVVPGANWVWNLSQTELTTHLSSTRSRPIEVERYDAGGGTMKWIAITVPDSGTTARSWAWLPNHTQAQIRSWASANNARIIDLDSFGSGSGQRWSALTVGNTGVDYKAYDWGVGQTPAQIKTRLGDFGGRLVKIERQLDGLYSYVQVDNRNDNQSAWWRMYGFRSATELNNFAAQMGARPVDIVRFSIGGTTAYDAVFIDNLNADSRPVRSKFFEGFLDADGAPIGITQAHLRRVDNGQVLVNFNASRRAEAASAIKLLHLLQATKQVNAGDPLGSRFTYFNYPTNANDPAHACPDSRYEGQGQGINTTLESGLDRMMKDSDNRMARAVVLRYGGFDALNTTAAGAGLSNTVLRHDDGCAYFDPVAGRYSPATLRNDTSAADLARLWAGVQGGSLLPAGSVGRSEFVFSVPAYQATQDPGLVALIREEAAALGRPQTVADAFAGGSVYQVQQGHYKTCLGDPADTRLCGQKVVIGSVAGMLALPSSNQPTDPQMRYYAHAILHSDVPVPNYDGSTAQGYATAMSNAILETLRPAIRECLQNW